MEEAGLSISIKNKRPIELQDFTNSLWSLADEFKRHIQIREPELAEAEVKLYIKDVHTGSIEATLVAIAPQALQLISYANAVFGFYKHIKGAYDFLSGDLDPKPLALDKKTYQNLSQLLEPVAKDSGSQFNIGTLNGPLFLSIDSRRANAIQNAARRELDALGEPITGKHEQVLLYWYQARGDAKSRSGDRAIIESIAPFAVKTICASEDIKAQMVLDHENPFNEAYIVDVTVETISGRPSLYRITRLHEKFARE